ncbi:MAG: hypothetical protein PCFJNLEI_01189 [Verrucomicrobiae bacterium]|nr:hypothetical protein [Verrucomicrobiae bacterium]
MNRTDPINMEQTEEFVIYLRQRRASPQDILERLTDAGEAILAHSLNGNGDGQVTLLLVTNDRLHTELILRRLGCRYDVDRVVLGRLPRQIGSAALLGMRLSAAGIRILYSYVSPGEANAAFVVFKTNDNQRAVAACAA